MTGLHEWQDDNIWNQNEKEHSIIRLLPIVWWKKNSILKENASKTNGISYIFSPLSVLIMPQCVFLWWRSMSNVKSFKLGDRTLSDFKQRNGSLAGHTVDGAMEMLWGGHSLFGCLGGSAGDVAATLICSTGDLTLLPGHTRFWPARTHTYTPNTQTERSGYLIWTEQLNWSSVSSGTCVLIKGKKKKNVTPGWNLCKHVQNMNANVIKMLQSCLVPFNTCTACF